MMMTNLNVDDNSDGHGNTGWRCCSYMLCRKSAGDRFRRLPLAEVEEGGSHDSSSQCGVRLDTASMGQQTVVVKAGSRVCGRGAVLATCPISQNKAFFEVKLQSGGTWGVGLATAKVNLDRVPLGEDAESWVLRENGSLWHTGVAASARFSDTVDMSTGSGSQNRHFQEGDVVGVCYDHEQLCFHLNGSCFPGATMRGMRGTLYPVVYVDDGAIVDVFFHRFRYPPPQGYSEILFEKQLL